MRLGELLDHVCGELLRRTPRSRAPVVRIEFCSYGNVAHVLRQAQRLDLLGGIGLCINRIRWPEEQRFYAQLGLKKALGGIELQTHEKVGDVADIRMREGVVTDLVAFVINAAGKLGEFFRLGPDYKKYCFGILALQYVENSGHISWVWPVVEAEGNLVFRGAVLIDLERCRIVDDGFACNQLRVRVQGNITPAPIRCSLYAENLAFAFQIDSLSGRDAAYFLCGVSFVRVVPHRPQRSILGTQPP